MPVFRPSTVLFCRDDFYGGNGANFVPVCWRGQKQYLGLTCLYPYGSFFDAGRHHPAMLEMPDGCAWTLSYSAYI